MDKLESTEGDTLRLQRDQALACAILAFCIAVAVILSNFNSGLPQYQQALQAVAQHKAILADNEKALQANESVLAQNLAALEKLRQATGIKQP